MSLSRYSHIFYFSCPIIIFIIGKCEKSPSFYIFFFDNSPFIQHSYLIIVALVKKFDFIPSKHYFIVY